MDRTTSADGTSIAFAAHGEGSPVVIVGGAFSTARDGEPLALALAQRGLRGVAIDRRGRGESGDTAPYAPEREAEDLVAVLDAVGAPAAVIGHSSGAVLSLLAASLGAPIRTLFLSEPPLRFGVDEPPADLATRMQTAIDDGRPEDAVTAFQLEGVGLPVEVVEQIRHSPMFDALAGLAQSTVYDATLAAAVSTPSARMLEVAVPTVVMRGARTIPFLITAADRLAAELPAAELVVSEVSLDHRLDPEDAATVIAARI